MSHSAYNRLREKFENRFGEDPASSAFAPGRVEVLGNHTDYNEGFVLSAAIDMATFFVVSPSADSSCRLVAADVDEEAVFDITSPAPCDAMPWANYVVGVVAGLQERFEMKSGFNAMFLSDVPLAAGLSSSAALEISAGMALADLYDIEIPLLDMARIAQSAEHNYAGVRCGLLDQISSLFGQADHLVLTDFRSLEVHNVPLGTAASMLVCNTGVKHTLVESEYNERRERCEAAAEFFKARLDHPVAALRDVSWAEWESLSADMEPVSAKRSAHVIGECERVLTGEKLLSAGKLDEFGELMFQSHDSSRRQFENSCDELDFIVDHAAGLEGVKGARLSGGGFGGSAVVLVDSQAAGQVGEAISAAYGTAFGSKCDVRTIHPSTGAAVI